MIRRTVTTTDVRAWCEAFDRGDSVRQIGADFGRCPKTIAAHLAPSGRVPWEHQTMAARIRRMADGGAETWAIADALGVTRNHVSAVRSLAKRRSREAAV